MQACDDESNKRQWFFWTSYVTEADCVSELTGFSSPLESLIEGERMKREREREGEDVLLFGLRL